MEIQRSGSQPSRKGPADWFTGAVRIDPLLQVRAPARAAGSSVTFEPGARTAWHTHPLGQTLIITAGCGWVQREGGPVEEVHPGDVVWFPPGEKHWHGATPTTAMTHIAIQEQLDGKVVDWMEQVSVCPGSPQRGRQDVAGGRQPPGPRRDAYLPRYRITLPAATPPRRGCGREAPVSGSGVWLGGPIPGGLTPPGYVRSPPDGGSETFRDRL